jgi:hypothetical protein
MINSRQRKISNAQCGRALVHRAGAPLPEDPHARIHLLREEIAAAAAEVRRVRKWWRDPYWSSVRLFLSPFAGTVTVFVVYALDGGWVLATLAGAAVAAAFIGGPEALAQWLARADLRMRRRELRQELHRLPRQEQYRVVRHFNHHPDPDTNRIVTPLIDELRSAFPELAPAAAPEGDGNEPAPT